jgi:hypothetical protein
VASYETALVEIQATTGCDVLVAELDEAVVGMCQLIVFRHFQAVGLRGQPRGLQTGALTEYRGAPNPPVS